MKKLKSFLIMLATLIVVIALTLLFIWLYIQVGFSSNEVNRTTLFATLSSVDYQSLLEIFLLVAIYLFILDFLVVNVFRSWRKTLGKASNNRHRSRLYRYWMNYRKIHITFILLAIFITLSITAPSSVMNSFTAIVSISVLVSNLTKKLGE